uniref:Uncharacterized protein n=1 Tax=Ditylenchus dipsaci TaxID=166011 RepID=A0A915DRG0_9BILA
MWLIEALWVLNIRMDNSSWREMPWTIFDVCCVTVFLMFLLSVRIAGTYLPKLVQFNSFAYTQKAAWSMFLLYECYKTLFIYIPLSDVLGPLMVRIKLMITRDFVNFIILVLLVVFSSAFAIKALVFPDLGLNVSTAGESLSWALSALFTTDLTLLKESEQCHRMLLPNQRTNQCKGIGGYADPRCPTQGWLGQLTVVEYLLILKLISWPILFALFARTAKQVDDEADRIWKYQLYSLATNFSLRPSLPPPLTPLFFAGHQLPSRCSGFAGIAIHKPSTVYRNPSVPSSRSKNQNRYWTRLSIAHWKSTKPQKSVASSKSGDKELSEKLKLLFLFNTTFGSDQGIETAGEQGDGAINEDSQPSKYTVKEENRSWTSEFGVEVKKNVQDDSAQNVIELGKHWRHRKFSELLSTAGNSTKLPSHKSYALSCDGLPLNPQGRTGLAGRGEYARFGPNKLFIYVMFTNKSDNLSVLTTSSSSDLPSKWRYGLARSDEFLEQLLTLIGVQDTEIQLMTSRGYLEVGQAESHLAHVASKTLHSSKDTDNAWTEADVWAADLSYLSDFNLKIDGYEWKPVSSAVFSSADYQEFVELSLQG